MAYILDFNAVTAFCLVDFRPLCPAEMAKTRIVIRTFTARIRSKIGHAETEKL